jgi:multidrug resistance protein MdtO
MVIAATLVMIICETFRIPYAFEAAIYTLIISRASPRATLQSSGAALLFVGVGGAYVLISASFVISVPILHFLWVIVHFFCFLCSQRDDKLRRGFNIRPGDRCRHSDMGAACLSGNERGRYTLAHVGGIGGSRGYCGNRAGVARVNPGDEIVLPVAERLSAVESLLDCYAKGCPQRRK